MFQLFVDFIISFVSMVVLVIGGGDIFAHTVPSGLERGSRAASEFQKVLQIGLGVCDANIH